MVPSRSRLLQEASIDIQDECVDPRRTEMLIALDGPVAFNYFLMSESEEIRGWKLGERR